MVPGDNTDESRQHGIGKEDNLYADRQTEVESVTKQTLDTGR